LWVNEQARCKQQGTCRCGTSTRGCPCAALDQESPHPIDKFGEFDRSTTSEPISSLQSIHLAPGWWATVTHQETDLARFEERREDQSEGSTKNMLTSTPRHRREGCKGCGSRFETNLSTHTPLLPPQWHTTT
jgi:hypothetical protein